MENSFMLGALLVAGISLVLVAEHRIRRKFQRRCPECKRVWGVKRKYQMVENRAHDARSVICQDWQTFIFAVCKCGHVRCVRSENRHFPVFEVRWRKFWDRRQFALDPKLFIRAGVDLKSKNLDFHQPMPMRHAKVPVVVVPSFPKPNFDRHRRN